MDKRAFIIHWSYLDSCSSPMALSWERQTASGRASHFHHRRQVKSERWGGEQPENEAKRKMVSVLNEWEGSNWGNQSIRIEESVKQKKMITIHHCRYSQCFMQWHEWLLSVSERSRLDCGISHDCSTYYWWLVPGCFGGCACLWWEWITVTCHKVVGSTQPIYQPDSDQAFTWTSLRD